MFGFLKSKKEPRTINLKISISVVVEQDEGAFHAYAPALKGLHVDGATEKEALKNAVAAVQCYLESLVSHGDPLPVGTDFTVSRRETYPQIPAGALKKNLIVEWPSHQMSGAR